MDVIFAGIMARPIRVEYANAVCQRRVSRHGPRQRADAQDVSRVVGRLVAQESDRRVAIWLRVRLGGERMTAVAADYGYRDGSGVHRVVQRLDEKAKGDQALARRLKALAREVSNVKS